MFSTHEMTHILYFLKKSKFSFYFILFRRFTVNQLIMFQAKSHQYKGVLVTEYLEQSIVIGHTDKRNLFNVKVRDK